MKAHWVWLCGVALVACDDGREETSNPSTVADAGVGGASAAPGGGGAQAPTFGGGSSGDTGGTTDTESGDAGSGVTQAGSEVSTADGGAAAGAGEEDISPVAGSSAEEPSGGDASGGEASTPAGGTEAVGGDESAEPGDDVELTPEEIEDLLAMPKQEFRFHHVHINAVDPAASIDFYEAHVEATAIGVGDGVSGVRSGHHWLLFDAVQSPAPWELTSAIFHVGFGVDSVQSGYDSLVAAGVQSETEPFNTSQRLCTGGGGTPNVAFLYGPDREVFEINPANSPDFRHVHFLSKDPIAAGQWYVEHAGFSSNTPNPSSAVNTCQGVQISPTFSGSLDGISVLWYPVEFAHGYYPEFWEGREEFDAQRGRVIDHLAFSVEDLDRAVARLRAEAVTILQPPETTLDGQLRSAFIEAPDGVQIEIVEGHVE